jgi:hypothetical protein
VSERILRVILSINGFDVRAIADEDGITVQIGKANIVRTAFGGMVQRRVVLIDQCVNF